MHSNTGPGNEGDIPFERLMTNCYRPENLVARTNLSFNSPQNLDLPLGLGVTRMAKFIDWSCAKGTCPDCASEGDPITNYLKIIFYTFLLL